MSIRPRVTVAVAAMILAAQTAERVPRRVQAAPAESRPSGVQIGDLDVPAQLAAKHKRNTAARSAAGETTAINPTPATTARPALTDAALGEMLDNLGLTVAREPNAAGATLYSFVSKHQNWAVPIKVQLSVDQQYVWWKASIVMVDDAGKLTPAQWLELAKKNYDLNPNNFCVLSDGMLTLVRVERNLDISPQLSRQWIEWLTENVIASYSLWEPLLAKKADPK